MKEKNMFPLNLQYFAEEGDTDNQNENSDNGNENKNEDQNSNAGGKTFTQDEVNRMMTREKNQGKNSILKSLGFKTEEEAKKAMDLYNALIESQKSQDEKASDELNSKSAELEEQTRRAEEAENKLLCFQFGVNKDSIEDVLAIAMTKVNDKDDLNSVLKSMKKETKYSSFFEESNNGSGGGTGRQPGHSNSGTVKPGEYGKSLAESNKTNNRVKESKFF